MSLKKQFVKSKKKCKVTFQLPVKATNGGKEVRLLGDFNDWSWEQGIPMKKSRHTYSTVVELPIDQTFEFRYLVDNRDWENDWEADGYSPTPFGVENSIVCTSK